MSVVEAAARARPISELAEKLRISPLTMRKWTVNGVNMPDGTRLRLKSTRLPGRILVNENDLECFLAKFNPGT